MPIGDLQRLPGAQVFHVEGRTGSYLVVWQDGAATCTCLAHGECWHIQTVRDEQARPLWMLDGVQADRERLDAREREQVALARHDGHSWERIAGALGRTSEGVRKRYRSVMAS